MSTSILSSSVTPFRTTMQRRSSRTWAAIFDGAELFEVEQVNLAGIRSLEQHLRYYSSTHDDAYFSVVYDDVTALATVQKVAAPFRNPVTGRAVRIRMRRGSAAIDSNTAAEWLANVTEEFVEQATRASVAEFLGTAFSAFVLRHRRDLTVWAWTPPVRSRWQVSSTRR